MTVKEFAELNAGKKCIYNGDEGILIGYDAEEADANCNTALSFLMQVIDSEGVPQTLENFTDFPIITVVPKKIINTNRYYWINSKDVITD